MVAVAVAASYLIQEVLITVALRIASNVLTPAVKGPRVSDLRVTTSTYGVAIPRVFGSEGVRYAGNVFWSSGLLERRHKKGGFLTPKQVTYTYSENFAVGLADRSISEGPASEVPKLWANGKVIFDASLCVGAPTSATDGLGRVIWRKYTRANGTHSLMKSVTFYYGSFEQPIDPVIEGAEGGLGVGETPAYRGLAYMVIELLQLESFGESTPNIEALVINKAGQTLAEVIDIMCSDAGIDAVHDISTSALVDRTVRGYVVGTVGISCWEAMAPLQAPLGFSVADVGGQLRFIPRAHTITATIPAEDMAGHAYGDERPEANRFARLNPVELPREAALTFQDPARDYQANTQTDRRQVGSAKSNISNEVPLVLSEAEGRAAAGQLLWEAHAGQASDRFTLTKRWLHLQAGRVYAIPTSAGWRPFRITRRTRGANDLIEAEATADESVVYTYQPPGAAAPAAPNDVDSPADTVVQLLDLPNLQDSDDDDGFYVVADGGAGFRGANVERSTDGGATFAQISAHDSLAVTAAVTGAAFAAGTTTGFDDVTVLRVTLTNSGETLESCTDAELAAGVNLCCVGTMAGLWEVAQFGVATEVSAGVYDLTHWKRGLRGTDFKVATHGASEKFVLLDRYTLQRVDFGAADWTLSRLYQGVLDDGDAGASFAFTNTGEGRRPRPPSNVLGSRDGSLNLTITWDRESRFSDGGLGTDAPETYKVEIYTGGGVLKRTIAGLTATTAPYSAADQVTDFGATQATVHARVYQVGPSLTSRARSADI